MNKNVSHILHIKNKLINLKRSIIHIMACLNFIHAVLCVSIRIIIVTGSLQPFRKRSLNNHNNDKNNIPWNTSLKSDLPEILFSYKLYISLHTLFCTLGVSRIHTFRYQLILFSIFLPETLSSFLPD